MHGTGLCRTFTKENPTSVSPATASQCSSAKSPKCYPPVLERRSEAVVFLSCTAIDVPGPSASDLLKEYRLQTRSATISKELESDKMFATLYSKSLLEARRAHLVALLGLEEETRTNLFALRFGCNFLTIAPQADRQHTHSKFPIPEHGIPGSHVYSMFFTGTVAVLRFIWDSSPRFYEFHTAWDSKPVSTTPPIKAVTPPLSTLILDQRTFRAMAATKNCCESDRKK